MTRIKLVVSDVDGTLVTKDKRVTEAASAAVQKLRAAGIGFTIVSSRPTIGMEFLIAPLKLSLPFGAFNGSAIVDPTMRPIEQHLIPTATVQRAIALFEQFGVDIWLFTSAQWLARNPDGEYVGHEVRAIKHDPVIVANFAPYLDQACKIVGASSDPELLRRCEAAMQQAVGKTPLPPAPRPIISTSRRPATTRERSSRRWRRDLVFASKRWRPSETWPMTCRCSQGAGFPSRWAMRPMTSSGMRRM